MQHEQRSSAAAVSDKREFYSRAEISESYDQQRFGGASGARVNQREIEIVLDLVPEAGRVLDLACGTGRLAQALSRRGQTVFGLDYSPPMAARTASLGVPTSIGDAFCTPFQRGVFDSVVSMRFAFHYADLGQLLTEMRDLSAPGGCIVFDTYSWSPRSLVALGASRWGGAVKVHSPARVLRTSTEIGLRVERMIPCFLFSPYLYRLAPLAVEQVLESIERRVPHGMLCRVFWKLVRA